MKEDFLDFGIANNEYVYCSTGVETQGRTGSIVLDAGNQMETQEDEDMANSSVASESSSPVKKSTRCDTEVIDLIQTLILIFVHYQRQFGKASD